MLLPVYWARWQLFLEGEELISSHAPEVVEQFKVGTQAMSQRIRLREVMLSELARNRVFNNDSVKVVPDVSEQIIRLPSTTLSVHAVKFT
jgi:hypothetical protein